MCSQCYIASTEQNQNINRRSIVGNYYPHHHMWKPHNGCICDSMPHVFCKSYFCYKHGQHNRANLAFALRSKLVPGDTGTLVIAEPHCVMRPGQFRNIQTKLLKLLKSKYPKQEYIYATHWLSNVPHWEFLFREKFDSNYIIISDNKNSLTEALNTIISQEINKPYIHAQVSARPMSDAFNRLVYMFKAYKYLPSSECPPRSYPHTYWSASSRLRSGIGNTKDRHERFKAYKERLYIFTEEQRSEYQKK